MAKQEDAALAQAVLDALESPTCAVGPDGLLIAVNQAWRDFTVANGGRPASCDVGVDYLAVCRAVAVSSPDALDATAVDRGLQEVLTGTSTRFQRDYACHGQSLQRWYSVRATPLPLPEGRGAVISHVDVSVLHALKQSLTHQALHDPLTGLPNRVLLEDRMQQAAADGQRRGGRLAVALLDLDEFKAVNDTLGHAAGDALLVLVAERLTARLRSGDTLCRYAGDEFVVLWREISSALEAEVLCRRLLTAFREPFPLGREHRPITASTGLAVGRPQDGHALLASADAAMYDGKRQGHGRLVVVDAPKGRARSLRGRARPWAQSSGASSA